MYTDNKIRVHSLTQAIRVNMLNCLRLITHNSDVCVVEGKRHCKICLIRKYGAKGMTPEVTQNKITTMDRKDVEIGSKRVYLNAEGEGRKCNQLYR